MLEDDNHVVIKASALAPGTHEFVELSGKSWATQHCSKWGPSYNLAVHHRWAELPRAFALR